MFKVLCLVPCLDQTDFIGIYVFSYLVIATILFIFELVVAMTKLLIHVSVGIWCVAGLVLLHV